MLNEIFVLARNPANQPLDVMPERIFYECHQRPDTEICLSFLDKFCLKDKHPSLNLKLKTSRIFANSNKSSVSDAIVEFCFWQNCSKVEKWKPPKPAAVTAIQDLPQGPQMPFWAPGYFSTFKSIIGERSHHCCHDQCEPLEASGSWCIGLVTTSERCTQPCYQKSLHHLIKTIIMLIGVSIHTKLHHSWSSC